MNVATATDVKWLGVHYDDLFDEHDKPVVPEMSLQPWTVSDEQVYSGLSSTLQYMVSKG